MFTTVDDAYKACEAAGLEPRIQHGGLGETSYWVYLGGSYISYWSDQQFLSWANAYFAREEAASPDEDDTDSDEDVFFVLPSAARGGQVKSTRYMVMSAFLWSSIEPPVSMDPGGPQRFIPVFDTKEQALAWLDGDESEIRELITEKA